MSASRDVPARGRGLRGFGPFVVAVLELVVFVLAVRWIGFGWTILLMLATSIVGFGLLRFAGIRAWASLRQSAARGGVSAAGSTQIADTGARLLAGALLVLPGFVTDLAGLILLLPPVRRLIGRRLSAAVFRTFPARPRGGRGGGPTDPNRPQHRVVIEGEVVDPDHPRDR